ncbi:MAG: patatin-like phospholipase family protein [Candidatus Omnitrophica bacterium]|nr:patatin-like phospholipase family protein [Candidatus Omnitrophota bacterium]
MRLVEYKRGDYVYEEGKPADAFYVIVSGRFRVFQKARGEEDKTLIFLYRGDYFGESSLLTGHVHSASVEARSDGILLKLDKENFLKVLEEIPALSIHLSRTLGHRLTKIEDPGKEKLEVKVASLYSSLSSPDSFQFLEDLATDLVQETKSRVIIIDFLPVPDSSVSQEFLEKTRNRFPLTKVDVTRESDLKPFLLDCPPGFQYLPIDSGKGGDGEKRLSTLLTFLTYRFDFLLIRLGREMGDWSSKALKQSDLAYLLLDPSDTALSKALPIIHELEKTFGFSKSEIKVILPERNNQQSPTFYDEKEKTLNLKIFSVLPVRSKQPERYHSTMRFISKELAGTLLGLVLGSGAAYGLAHIGVLRVLEKENISVDVIAGSSMGALVAAFWASGYRANDLEKIAKSLDRRNAFFKLIGFRDLSLAHHGFFHGHQVTRYMESFLGDRTFRDLQIPVRVVATNLSTSQAHVFETGRIVDAVRASISIPGIFRPLHYAGGLLIDGGILDPLPVDVLAKMGVKKIIAVNVLLGPEDRAQKTRVRAEKRKQFLTQKSDNIVWRKILTPLSERLNQHFSGNIFNVIMHTIQFMEYEIAEVASQEADVLIHPIVHDANWAEFYDPDKFIRAGEEKTLEQIDEIKQLLSE